MAKNYIIIVKPVGVPITNPQKPSRTVSKQREIYVCREGENLFLKRRTIMLLRCFNPQV